MTLPPRFRTLFLAAAAGVLASCSDAPDPVGVDVPVPAMSVQGIDGDYVFAVSKGRFDAVSAAVVAGGGAVVRSHPQVGILIAGGLSTDAAAALAGMDGVQAIWPTSWWSTPQRLDCPPWR